MRTWLLNRRETIVLVVIFTVIAIISRVSGCWFSVRTKPFKKSVNYATGHCYYHENNAIQECIEGGQNEVAHFAGKTTFTHPIFTFYLKLRHKIEREMSNRGK